MQRLLRGGLTEPGGTTAALWSYIHPVLKYTDFGGKTGTSNNHSDAWFVGVTPKLVAGGWVGGEYRSHTLPHRSLRTRQSDGLTHIRQLHPESPVGRPLRPIPCQIPEKPLEDIDPTTYTCESYYAPQEPDSLTASADSLGIALPGDSLQRGNASPEKQPEAKKETTASEGSGNHPQASHTAP